MNHTKVEGDVDLDNLPKKPEPKLVDRGLYFTVEGKGYTGQRIWKKRGNPNESSQNS